MTKSEWLNEVAKGDRQAAKLLRDVPEEVFGKLLIEIESTPSIDPVTALLMRVSRFSERKTRRKSFQLTERAQSLLSDIQEKYGFPSEAATVHHCIVETHRKIFPVYTPAARRIADARTPDERRRDTRAAVSAEAEGEALAECRRIAAALGGKVEHDNGVEYVVWNTYNFGQVYSNRVPLDQMVASLIDMQYSPDRETCERLLKSNQ